MNAAAQREALEAQIRSRCLAGDRTGAATLLIEGYGRELLGFLISRLGDRSAADDAFSRLSEDLWVGIEGFRWQCTARVWAYTLARHAAGRHAAEVRRYRGRHVPMSHAGPASEIAERVRTATRQVGNTRTKSAIAALREQLPLEDQSLLVLRVNRGLNWNEIAQVIAFDHEVTPDRALEQEAARLRKRYQLVKEKLRRLAVKEGLIDGEG